MTMNIGVDIGGTKMAAAAIDKSGAISSAVVTIATPAQEGAEAIAAAVADLVEQVETPDTTGRPIGVGSAGVISSTGHVLSATNAIAGWQGFHLQTALEDLLHRPVLVLNDVHAAALGEARHGAGRPYRSFLMVTVGTGLGGAIWLDGNVWTGATGTAGSLGHMDARDHIDRLCSCGQSGHLEAYVSGPAMEKAYTERAGKVLSLRNISAARKIDRHASETIKVAAQILGRGLGGVLNVIDVDAVILGGGVASIGSDYVNIVAQAMSRSVLPGLARVPLIPARRGINATMIGAGSHARSGAGHPEP